MPQPETPTARATDLRAAAQREYILLALMEAGSMYRDGAESFLAEYDAARAAEIRGAVLAEAAAAAEVLIPALQREYPEEPSNSPWCCGVKDAAAEIRRIASLPTA